MNIDLSASSFVNIDLSASSFRLFSLLVSIPLLRSVADPTFKKIYIFLVSFCLLSSFKVFVMIHFCLHSLMTRPELIRWQFYFATWLYFFRTFALPKNVSVLCLNLQFRALNIVILLFVRKSFLFFFYCSYRSYYLSLDDGEIPMQLLFIGSAGVC